MNKVLVFLGGLIIGGGASYLYHKNKYEVIIQKEIDELRELKAKAKGPRVRTEMVDEETVEDVADEPETLVLRRDHRKAEDIQEAKKIIDYNRYAVKDEDNKIASHHDRIIEECMTEKAQKPFFITPEAFGSLPGFDADTFYYHSNEVVVNDNREVIDVEEFFEMQMLDIRDQFGVYEEHAVYIRNYALQCDYEVLRDYSEFDEDDR